MTRRLFARHRPRRRWLRKSSVVVLAVTVATAGVLWACDWWIEQGAAPYATDRIDSVPSADVALVLGTSPRVAGQRRNLYFEYRLDAAAELHKAGKVRYLLVSGDQAQDYDEPSAMREGLIDRGVPAEAIYRDFAGVRTLDSVLRARDVFAQSRYVVVSQGFHNHRAIWLARQHGIEAYGFDARDVAFEAAPLVHLRQYLSAARAIIDILIGSTAQHNGPRVEIGSAPPN